MSNIFADPVVRLLLFYPVFLFSLSLHETAHGWIANRFGDPTARYMGRVSLNPLRHIDLIGTVVLPIFAIYTGTPMIGWAKPVPVNPMHLKNARKNNTWIAAAGPLSNFLLSLAFSGLCWIMYSRLTMQYFEYHILLSKGSIPLPVYIYLIFNLGVLINLILGIFNLLPIFPLDGGNILRGIIPDAMVESFDKYARYGMFLIIILFFTGLLKFLSIPIDYILSGLLPFSLV